MAAIARKHSLPVPFHEYELDDAFDEIVDRGGAVRPHYRQLYQALDALSPDELRRQQAYLSFLHQGITVTAAKKAVRKFSPMICCLAS